MTHNEAVEQNAIEQYVLGELTGEERQQFEAHLFSCQQCADNLRDTLLFAGAARHEFSAGHREEQAIPAEERISFFSFKSPFWQRYLLLPAFAICLLVIMYQSLILLPHLEKENGKTSSPIVSEPLILASASPHKGSVPEVVAPKRGFYLLSVNIPASPDASAYRCSLYQPSGSVAWQVNIPRQAKEPVTIEVPVTTAKAGLNELLVQSISSAPGRSPVNLALYTYKLSFAN